MSPIFYWCHAESSKTRILQDTLELISLTNGAFTEIALHYHPDSPENDECNSTRHLAVKCYQRITLSYVNFMQNSNHSRVALI